MLGEIKVRRVSENAPEHEWEEQRTAPSLRLVVLICVLVFVVIAAGALMAPGLRVTEVYCEGSVNVRQEDIIVAAQISIGENIFLAKTGKARREVEKIPFVKEAEVKRIFPDKICVRVTERVPAGYIIHGTECAVLDNTGMVIDIGDVLVAAAVKRARTPEYALHNAENGDADADTNDADAANDEEESAEGESIEDIVADMAGIDDVQLHPIPLIAGVELEAAESGKTAKCSDENKLRAAMNICSALGGAQLLERTTYIDVSDILEVRLMIEDRLDVRLGTSDNIEYRAKFLAEVINTKISAYEKVVMDYHGDDIYVRVPEMPKKQDNSSQ